MKWLVRFILLFLSLLPGYHYWHIWLTDKVAGFPCFVSLFLILCVLGYLLIRCLQDTGSVPAKTAMSLMLLLFSFCFALLVSELALRSFDQNLKSYGERNGAGHYSTAYRVMLHKCDSCGGGYYFINQPNGTEEFSKQEFHYIHKYNSLGLRDHEFTEHKDSNEFRILGVGDSFTEGVGTTEDSTWLKQLEHMLNADPHRFYDYTTLNGGAHGSDLIFSYELLSHCLLKYHPDMVILNLNSTDIGDIVTRGTAEGINLKNGYAEGHAPWWEYLYGSSYLVRLFVMDGLGYNWELLSAEGQRRAEKEAVHAISEKIKDFGQLAHDQHFFFLLLIQPLKDELTSNVLNQIELDSSIERINLAPYFAEKINKDHEPLSKYYWPIDGHFTNLGYELEARAIYNRLAVPIKK